MFFDQLINVILQFQKTNTLQQTIMQGPGKTKDDTQLPKIRSQQRIHTANDRRNTEQDKALMNRVFDFNMKPLSNNCRTRSLRAFTTRSVKYESAGSSFNKKMEDIQKQTFLVDRQIKSVQDQIKNLRQTIGISKKQSGISRLNQSSVSYMSKIISKKNITPEQETIKAQLKNLQAKILNYRNKIDTHLEKNKAIQQQIDAYRKQISTLKNINSQLQISFKQTSQKYDEQMQLSKKLDAQIAQKTELTHRKKIQNMHQKTQMIKQYDVILKTLDKQLTTQKNSNEEGKSQFYLTDIVDAQNHYQDLLKKDQTSARQLTSEKKPKISEIRQKLKNYEKQFEELKRKVGSQNIQQITKQFTEEYQKNFHQYNFINQMYRQYEETNNQQFQLLQKKSDLIKQLQGQKSGSKVQQIHEMKSKINKINQKIQKVKQDMNTYQNMSTQIKVYLSQYQMALPKNNEQINSQQQLNDKSVSLKLNQIFQKISKQYGLIDSQKCREKRFSKNSLSYGKQTIEDLIQEVKKQSQNSKDNRLLSRQQLQNNTIQLKQKKMESSINYQKYKTRKQTEKIRSQNNKKLPQ